MDENYKALGEAPENVLQEAWLSIYFEYLQLMDSGATNDRIRHIGQIHVLSSKIHTVKLLTEAILKSQIDLLFPVLHDLGYNFVKTEKDLPRVIAMIKRDEMELKILINNLPADKGSKPSKQTFDDILFRISEFLHTIIHKDKITVSEYCAMVSSYEKHIQSINQKVKNHGK